MSRSDILKLLVAIPIVFFIFYFLIDVGLTMFKRLDTFLGVIPSGKE